MVWDKDPGEAPEMTQPDRDMIKNRPRRITIPLENRLLLRQVADVLRGLANQLDFDSRMADLSERSVLFSASVEINCANRKIRALAQQHGIRVREGRPTDKERLGHSMNEKPTSETVSAGETQDTVVRFKS